MAACANLLDVQPVSALRFLASSKHARGVAVEPVDQLQESQLGTLQPQLLDDSAAYAAAAMRRDPGGLVEHQHGLILEQGLARQHGDGRRRPQALCRARGAQRRDPHPVARLQPVGGVTRRLLTRTWPVRRMR